MHWILVSDESSENGETEIVKLFFYATENTIVVKMDYLDERLQIFLHVGN